MDRITLDVANRIIAAALAEGARRGARPVAVAVLGPEGHVISLQRQDGASMFRIEIATGKAWGAVAMGVSTRALGKRALDNPSFMNGLSVASGGRILTSPGGVVIVDQNGTAIGSVGISGDTGETDEQLAIHAIRSVGLSIGSDG